MRNNFSWEEIEYVLKKDIANIFNNINLEELSDYEKRKRIFCYLTKNLTYDYQKLIKIRMKNLGLIKSINRDIQEELLNTIFLKKGICNSISQYYKLLLDLVGIKSYCVICDDGTETYHELNLVLNSEKNTYSFDDVTSVIVKKGKIEDYFDYDLELAHKHSQGLRDTKLHTKWIIIPNGIIYSLVNLKIFKSGELSKIPEDKIIRCKVKSKK